MAFLAHSFLAARMESTGVRNKIQVSQETAELLTNHGHGKWLIPRSDAVMVKGKGEHHTYFLNIVTGSKSSSITEESGEIIPMDRGNVAVDSKSDRLVGWNVEVLSGLLRRIVARREALSKKPTHGKIEFASGPSDKMVLDEVKEIITLPAFNEEAIKKQVDPDSIVLDKEVVSQLTNLITRIASMYQ
jgi:hypothetical protein